MAGELVSRGLTLRSVDKEKRSVDFVASTDAVDSYDEVVEQDWILDRFLANPVILFGHNSRDLPVGTATRCEVVEVNGRKQLECTIQFLTAAANPMAEQVWHSVQEGGLRAVSVGFMPGDYRFEKRNGVEVFVLSQNVLHEISVVPIPANPEALAKWKSKARALEAGATLVDENGASIRLSANGDIHFRATGAVQETTMLTEKEMQERIAKADAEKSHAEKLLADATKAVEAAKTELRTAESTVKALEGDRDSHKARADKAEKSVVEAEVAQLVGKKITPAEKDDFVALAQTNRPMFERMVAARPEMKLLGGQVVPNENGELPAVADAPIHTNGGDLASKIFSS